MDDTTTIAGAATSIPDNGEQPLVFLHGICRQFRQGDSTLDVLRGAELAVWAGQSVALVGPSGAGKSTLLQIAGLLEHPDAGEVYIDAAATTHLSDVARTRIRRTEIGFVYQFHHLLPEFSALENVAMPLLVRRERTSSALSRARDLLARVGLAARLNHRPHQLSGGERQRTAVARALVTSPALVLADEPTGNLDGRNAEQLFALMLELNREFGTSLVVVTHDGRLAARMERVLELSGGVLRPPAS
jgi:lipoprotein-releasing system ATP-binding protein